jgi:hypothetical protein
MAMEVLPSIETGGDPASANGSVLSDDTYVEQGTPSPNDPEERLAWGRRRYGEGWYLEEVAWREAGQKERCEREERERIEDEKVEAIRKLRETEPWEYERRMTEYNLQLKGLTKAQIDKSNEPRSKEEIESMWAGFSALLQGRTLQPATVDKHINTRSESIEVLQPRVSLRLQKPTKGVSRKIRCGRIAKGTTRDRTTRSGNRSKRPAPTLAGALVDATNIKVSRSKHDKTRPQKKYKRERASRRLASKPVEYGIFANRNTAPVPKELQRNP